MEPFELYFLVVVLRHLLLILGHSLRSLIFDFIQTIQVQLQLVVVAVFVKKFCHRASLMGMTASMPYVSLKGVSPIRVLAVVL